MDIEEAIEILKNMDIGYEGEATCKECIFDNNKKCYDENGDCQMKAIKIVLQVLEKLQKHCKEMIKEKQELTSALLDSIPKKKIEDKILQEWQKCPKNSINDFAIVERNNKIQVLQELLEEK